MESSSAAKRGIRGEETLTAILFMRVITLLLLKSLSKEWFSIDDWEAFMISCCLVLQLLAIYNFPTRKKKEHSEMVFRPGVNSGVYCVLLVPMVLLTEALASPTLDTGDSMGSVSELLFLLATVCGMLLIAPLQLKKTFGILYLCLVLASALTVLLLRLHHGGNSLPWLSGFAVTMSAAYYLPHVCFLSFTYGELCVICHILGSAVFRMGSWMADFIFSEEWPVVTDEAYVNVFVSVLVLFVVLASALVLYWDWCDNIVPFVLVYFAFGLIAVGVLIFLTAHNPILWLFWFIFGQHRRVSLLAWWSAVAVVTIINLALYTQHMSSQSGKSGRASTAARKVFHAVVVAVYVPGLVVDPLFLLLASVVALAVLGVLEMARLINVQWLGPAVDTSFREFVDDRDQGPIFLTHIYLLVGLSVPLWLSHNVIVGDVRNFCGVIALGIGDTVACVVGMQYGNTKWPGTKKSIEGTVSSVAAQILFILLAFYVGWLEGFSWFSTLFAVIASSVYEAFVSQIDNLVLPLYMLAALPPAAVEIFRRD